MSCKCINYQCLEVLLDMCSSGVELPLVADETGTWHVEIEFNGTWIRLALDVTDGENIVIPNVLNENYIHTVRLLNEAGEVFNDICYKLDSQLTDLGGYPYTPPAGFKQTHRVDFTVNGNPTTIATLIGATILKIDVEKMEVDGTLNDTNGEVTFIDAVADGQNGYILYTK